MASTATSYNPSRDDFAAMLDESFAGGNLQESSVIKGKVVAIEKDMAVIDVGLKTEGRVALREFNGPGRENDLKVGDDRWRVAFDDWMFLQPGGIVLNRATVTRWGIEVGTLTVSFAKPAATAASVGAQPQSVAQAAE